MTDWDGDGGFASWEAAVARVRELEAALQRIRDHGQTHDEPCYAIHNGDCADVFQEIARAVLA